MANTENHLIELLSRSDQKRLLSHCETVPLALSQVLAQAGTRTRYAYFPVAGAVLLVASLQGHPGLGVGMVGREGMLGVQLVLGVAISPLVAQVKLEGTAWRIGRAAFLRALADSAGLRRSLGRYVHVRLAQQAATAVCMGMHRIAARLARWLLMCQDCAGSNLLHLTHETLASMLGVRRAGITNAAGTLQRSGLIFYRRGAVQILNRRGLEAAACGCYALERRIYQEVLD